MIARPGRLALCAAIAALALGMSGCGTTHNDAASATFTTGTDTLTARVTNSSFINELRQLTSNKQFTNYVSQQGLAVQSDSSPSSTPSKLSSVWLTQVLDSAIISGLLKNAGVTVPTTLPADVKSSIDFPLPESVITTLPKDLQQTMEQRKAEYYTLFQSCPSGKVVSHILLPTEAAARQVLAQLKAGQRFSTLATSKSVDSGSAQLGGLLGCLDPGEFIKEFQTAAEQAPLDTVVGPVKSSAGYHLILVNRFDPAVLAGNSAMSQAVGQSESSKFNHVLTDAKVWVNPKYGSWSQIQTAQGTQLGVKPPSAAQPRTSRNQTSTSTSTTPTTTVPSGG